MSKKMIYVDESTFNKITKRLNKSLSQEIPNLSLSNTKELLSKSFGFRNYDNLQEFYKKDIKKEKIIKFTSNDYLQFVKILNASNIDTLWWIRAEGLLKVILDYLDKKKNGVFNAEDISNYLIIENLFNVVSNENEEPMELKKGIMMYLNTLPSDQKFEQHLYLTMQLKEPLSIIKEIEKLNDVLLFSLDWFKENNLNFWKRRYAFDNIKKFEGNHLELKHSEVYSCSFKDKILHSHVYFDSWLSDSYFLNNVDYVLLKKLEENKKNIYFSDFLSIIFNGIVNIKLKENVSKIIKNFAHNYAHIVSMSDELNKLSVD